MTFDPETLQNISLLGFVLVFLGGLVTSLGPCNVATIPLIVGFVGGSADLSRRRSFSLSLAFALGLAVTFVLLGVAVALVGGMVGVAMRGWYYLVAVICFVIGLQMLGVLQLQIPTWFGRLRERVVTIKGTPGAFALGLVSGLVASQCATPVLAAILTYVMLKGALVYGAALLFVYALGRGVPVVLAGTFTGALKGLQSLGRWSEWIERASGVVIIVVGLYFLWIV
jgi:cytochrome c-type biogenesis protein